MNHFAKAACGTLILAALITGCGASATPDTSAIEIVLTEGVQTMVAAHFATQTARYTPASATAAASVSAMRRGMLLWCGSPVTPTENACPA